MFCVGVDFFHSGVGKTGVDELFYGVCCRFIVGSLVVAGEGQSGDDDVGDHEYDQNPGDDGSLFHRDFFDLTGDQGVEFFQPYDSGDSPEEAVQEVDTASEVEGDVAVVPEDFSEDDFGEYAAEVFVRAAEEGSESEQEAVGAVAVVVKEPGGKGDGESPDDAERTPDKAAAAHPDACCEAAEDGFDNITQKSADDEQQDDFVEAAAFSEYF